MRRIFIFSFLMIFTGVTFFTNLAECRMYDPKTGRFLQRDPIDFRNGENVYSYVGNQPINYTDPYGFLNPKGSCMFGKCLYTAEDFQNGKKSLKDELGKKYPWLSNDQLDKLANDLMIEMSPFEAKDLRAYGDQGKAKEAEDILKKICERIKCDEGLEEPKNEQCEQK